MKSKLIHDFCINAYPFFWLFYQEIFLTKESKEIIKETFLKAFEIYELNYF